jgi:hypothetical protein
MAVSVLSSINVRLEGAHRLRPRFSAAVMHKLSMTSSKVAAE